MPLSRHLPFALAAIAGLLGLAVGLWLAPDMAITIGADMFFLVYMVLTLAIVPKLTKSYLRKNAASSDTPGWLMFLVTLAAVGVSVVSLFLLINGRVTPEVLPFTLALAAPLLGWFTIHLMAAIHYARLFWQPEPGGDTPRKGLEFPGTKEPERWDFIYFAYVIGMTAQTSDVQISGSHIRSFNLAHAIVSFYFNTVLVAAAVNVAVSLGN